MSDPSPAESPVAEWIVRGAQGDEPAAEALFQHFYPAVFRMCLALLNDAGDAEEVAQDAFVYALSRLGRFDPSRSAFRTWLFTIALSRCRNKRRRRWLVQAPLEALASARPAVPREVEAALDRRGLRRQVWEALQSLPDPLQEAVVLRYLGEMRYRELGEMLGCNPKTAESRVRLGVERLRRRFEAAGVEMEQMLAELAA
jgi:RNA polymerase sigma-70 factor (ECF subfamily)